MADILVVKKLAVSHFSTEILRIFDETEKTPMRKSLVSNEQFPKKDLLRIAYNKEEKFQLTLLVKHMDAELILLF